MNLDANDVAALAYIGRRIRENLHGAGTWDQPGIAAGIRRMADRGFGFDACLDQVVNHARDRSAKSPGVLGHPIAARAAEESRHPHPVRAEEACPQHPGGRRGACVSCAADQLVIEVDVVGPGPVLSHDAALEAMRRALTNPRETA